jgi:hypothetical protein
MMRPTLTVLLAALLILNSTACLGPATKPLYSFEEYEQDYGKVYDTPEERQERKVIFEANLQAIMEHNRNLELVQGPFSLPSLARGYTMGVNEWTDRKIPHELPLGYVKKSFSSRAMDSAVNFLAEEPLNKQVR